MDELEAKLKSNLKKQQEEGETKISSKFLRKVVDQSVANNCLKLLVLVLQAFNAHRNTHKPLDASAFLKTLTAENQSFVNALIVYAQ
jgi:hypothetical protein